jgi:hypothetical protein
MVVDEKIVVKIGKASGISAKERMLQIVGSYFDVYRVTPVVRIKRDRVVEDVFAKEAELHKYFRDKQYTPNKSFSGSTELFDVELDVAVDKYEEVIGAKICKKDESSSREEERVEEAGD